MSQSVQESSFTRLPGRMNEKILHIVNQNMYVVIHIPEWIDHVVSFRITQTSGVEYSSHFVKISLFVVGCRGCAKMEERDNFVLGVTKMAGLSPCDEEGVSYSNPLRITIKPRPKTSSVILKIL